MREHRAFDSDWKCDECGLVVHSNRPPAHWLQLYIIGVPGRPFDTSMTGHACSHRCALVLLDRLKERLMQFERESCEPTKCAKCELGLVLVNHRKGCPKRQDN